MDYSISHEVFLLISSALAGIAIALIYDLFRIIRKSSSAGAVLTGVQDVLFLCLAIAVMFFVVFVTNNGKLRWYQFFGVLCGAILYFSWLSEPIIFFLQHFIVIFLKIFNFFFKILLTPLKFMYNIIYVCLYFVISPVLCLVRRIGQKMCLCFFRGADSLNKHIKKKW